VQLDITLPRMPCDWVSLDAIDASGRIQTSIEHEVFRQRLSARGKTIQATEPHPVGPRNETLPDHLHPDKAEVPSNYCGSCYGAAEQENQCCNTCEDVRQAYQKKGWIMPDYDTVEQCKREGFQDSILRLVWTSALATQHGCIITQEALEVST
jgi:endoplasmic reticulum-Golgi intermediate compartment protein 3